MATTFPQPNRCFPVLRFSSVLVGPVWSRIPILVIADCGSIARAVQGRNDRGPLFGLIEFRGGRVGHPHHKAMFRMTKLGITAPPRHD